MTRPPVVAWSAPEATARHSALVTPHDVARAERYLHAVDGDRHLTARALARRVAASRLGLDPLRVHIGAEPGGRPLLLDDAGDRLPAYLSITHAGQLVGVAVADEPVGLDVQDIEALRPVLTSDLVWTPTELADLAALPPSSRLTTAATWWTAKEAVLKSLGRGLLEPVEELEIRASAVPWRTLGVGAEHAAAIAGPGGLAALTSG